MTAREPHVAVRPVRHIRTDAPLPLVIALSPIPIVAVIAVLFSQHALANGTAFLVGWIIGVAGGLALLTAIAQAGGVLGSNDSTAIVVLRLFLGVVLLAAAVKKWRGRPRPGDAIAMPAWMARIDGIGLVGASGLALLLGVNPKNLLMNAAAAAMLAVGYRAFAGERGRTTLERLREWLAANDATVMSVLFLVFGVKLVGDAITAF